MMAEPVDIVRAWHEALNQGDIERLVALPYGGDVLYCTEGATGHHTR